MAFVATVPTAGHGHGMRETAERAHCKGEVAEVPSPARTLPPNCLRGTGEWSPSVPKSVSPAKGPGFPWTGEKMFRAQV